jgi:ankyrin repeat protein
MRRKWWIPPIMCFHFAILYCFLLGSPYIYAQKPYPDGITDLMRAARDGESRDFKSALKKNPDIDAQDVYGWTALIYAVARGDEGMAKKLISKNANVNIADGDGRTALIHAVYYERDKIVKLLIKKGAALDIRDNNGSRALGWAWAKGKEKIFDILQKAGASPLALNDKRADLYNEFSPCSPEILNREQSFRMLLDILPVPRLEGMQLKMRVLVGADGSIRKVRVLIGQPDGITEAAVKAAYQLKFRAATENSRPVESWYDYGISTSGLHPILIPGNPFGR